MEAYPKDYIAHNLPLILLSGLGVADEDLSQAVSYPLLQENVFRITSDLPLVTGSDAELLRRTFLDADASGSHWNARHSKETLYNIGFRVKEAGRDYLLPPRKANRPPSSPVLSPSSRSPPASPYSAPVLHSPISPLSPGSPVYPDGVMTPNWITKHQDLLPSIFISFFNFTFNPNLSSVHDNHLKATINQIKGVLASTSYRTRFVVVLCSEQSILDADIDGRLTNIRRATGLDSKTSLFFFPPNISSVETRAFVGTVLATLQPLCVEYYREVSKHVRSKRNRGSVPPPSAPPTSGTSQTLSNQGWNVRYEFKLAVLAEFRQEMDAAGRSYVAAYEGLMSQDVIEAVVSWSPRFNEARLLADVIAIRILRCLLWNAQTTAAVQSWENHKGRVQDLLDRRGKGSANYGWKAWEARWYRVMAEVIDKADLPVFAFPEPNELSPSEAARPIEIYAAPERTIPIGERIPPWQLLHHEGYWLNQSIKCTLERRRLAEEVPEEDRSSPAHSPASRIASKFDMYDTYLCPEPYVESPLPGRQGFNHSAMTLQMFELSKGYFSRRNQGRAVEQTKLKVVREYMRQSAWHDALRVSKELWLNLSWRHAGWWNLVEELGWALRECAFNVGDSYTVISVDFELLNKNFRPRPGWEYDLSRSLVGLPCSEPRPAVILHAGDVASFLSVRLAFSKVEGCVGETLQFQLVAASQAQNSSEPIRLFKIDIVFENTLNAVRVHHLPKPPQTALVDSETVQVQEVPLHRASSSDGPSLESDSLEESTGSFMVGSADLIFFPGQVKAFTFTSTPRESGNGRAVSCTLSMKGLGFELDFITAFAAQQGPPSWWIQGKSGPTERHLGHDRATYVKILPRPPKIRIKLPNLKTVYYTNELINVLVDILNDEEEEAEAAVEVRLLGSNDGTPELAWGTESSRDDEGDVSCSPRERASQITHLSRRPLGKLTPTDKTTESVSFRGKSHTADYVLEIKVLYRLTSDPDTPLSKIVASDILIVAPFGASYDFSPCRHPDPWPSFFRVEDDMASDKASKDSVTSARGITQKWCLTARIVSSATDVLTIETMNISVVGISGEVIATVTHREPDSNAASAFAPEEQKEVCFVLDVQKLTLEDRRSAALDLALDIEWRRAISATDLNKSSLLVPRLLAFGGEPRILASIWQREPGPPALIRLEYAFENPSMHFLTFNLTMEASEDFAFSGPKTTSLQLVPLSRHKIQYSLLPYVRGTWIQPQLKVVDMYFNKLLRISATEGMRSEKNGIMVWVDDGG